MQSSLVSVDETAEWKEYVSDGTVDRDDELLASEAEEDHAELYSQRVGRVSAGSGVGNGSQRFGGKRRYESRCCKREAVVSMVPALVEQLLGQIWCRQLQLEHLYHEIRAMHSP